MKKTLAKYWFQPYTPITFLILLIAAAYFFGYPFVKKAIEPTSVSSPAIAKPSTTPVLAARNLSSEIVVTELGVYMVLPTDETPTVIGLTDANRFASQAFFKNAKNGDYLVLYTKNKKAILFDLENKKIVNVAPIADTTPTPSEVLEEPRPTEIPHYPTPTKRFVASPSANPETDNN